MAIAVGALLVGCGDDRALIEIGARHRPAIEAQAPTTVFLPGTLASILVDGGSGEPVWGGRTDTLSLDPRTAEGLRLLALPISEVSPDMAAASDPVRAERVLRRAGRSILGIEVSISVYDNAFAGLRAAGFRETSQGRVAPDGPSLTPLPYDWRRSIVDGAATLGEVLAARPDGAEKVTLLAHSMGASVALWYLMYGDTSFDPTQPRPEVTWAGAKHVSKAILVAPPLRGSAVAIRNTINGNRLAGPLIPVYPPVMLATHPSSFELMPRARRTAALRSPEGWLLEGHLDPETWERQGWGLASDSARSRLGQLAGAGDDPQARALVRQRELMERAASFHVAADRHPDPPAGLELIVIAGEGRKTPAGLAFPERGRVKVVDHADGDGVVPLASATAGFEDAGTHPRKRLYRVDAVHASMLSDPAVLEIVLRELAAAVE